MHRRAGISGRSTLTPKQACSIFHDDRDLTAVDPGKTGLQGFRALAVWGDQGQGREQPIWIDDLSITLGGPVRPFLKSEADPYAESGKNEAKARSVILYSHDNPPVTPRWRTWRLRRRSKSTESPGRSTGPRGSAISSMATGTWWGR